VDEDNPYLETIAPRRLDKFAASGTDLRKNLSEAKPWPCGHASRAVSLQIPTNFLCRFPLGNLRSPIGQVCEGWSKVHLIMLAERANEHLDRVQAVVEGNGACADDSIAASWKRSAADFGVDPESNDSPRILTPGELKGHQERAKGLTATAHEELDQLYRIACPAGYVVLMSNEQGIVIDHRVEEVPSSRSANWGNSIGGVWSEEAEGTNGTGTCLAERRPITIHQSQHFRSRHIGASCSAAPIFGVHDELIGVLDISSTDPRLSEHAHFLAGALVTESARAIEERGFRERFRRQWIVAIAFPQAAGRNGLIAVDRDQQIVGLDHNARAWFARTIPSLETGTGFWTLFERDDRIFRAKDGDGDFEAQLTRIGSAETLPALMTPPEPSAAIWRKAESAWLHCRPRRGRLTNISSTMAPPQWRGGLTPRALHRVQDYIDSHLSEELELEQLARAAGLSLHHFARAFKTSVGVPPHQFVLKRRLSLARDLLTSTDRPIADIAISAGFSDQSHLARHFRQSFGVSPIAFRRSPR
jgi:AraC-like DNA-binding protein